jgi:hypothetical protein
LLGHIPEMVTIELIKTRTQLFMPSASLPLQATFISELIIVTLVVIWHTF